MTITISPLAALAFGVVVMAAVIIACVILDGIARRLDAIFDLMNEQLKPPAEVTVETKAPTISPEAVAALMRATTAVKHEEPDLAFGQLKPDECDHRRAKAAIRKANMPEGEPISCPTCTAPLVVGPRTEEGKPTVKPAREASNG